MEQQQEKHSTTNYLMFSAPLYEHKTPEFIESSTNNGFIKYGENNDYVDYLTYLYNRSGLHSAIVNGKVRFICGQGFEIKEGFENDQVLKNFISNPNKQDSLNELTKKAVLDRKVYGGSYYKIFVSNGKLLKMWHQPYSEVRHSVSGNVYFISKEWTPNQSIKKRFTSKYNTLPKDVKEIKVFNPANIEGESIVFFSDYRPQYIGYPLPEYHATIVDIETDIETANFHLNNVKTGFSAGTLINLYNGIPQDDESKGKLEREIKSKYAATDNAGEIIININDPNGKGAEIVPLRPNDLDKQFEQLRNDIQDRIVRGHEVVNGMLFGIKTEGQLGGRSELDLAWRLFNLNYIEPKQQELEREQNWILKVCGIAPALKIRPLKGLGVEITQSMIEKALTVVEMRKLIEDEYNIGLDIELKPTPTEPQKFSSQDIENKILTGLEKVGLSSENFEFASDEDVLFEYIKEKKLKEVDIDKLKSVKELRGIDIEKAFKKLLENNRIGGSWGGTETAPKYEVEDIQEPKETITFETRWKYAGPKDDKNRSFCAKLLSMDKLFTREEIDALNNDMKEFNTDVWKYKGGWYHDSDTDTNYPQCRHWWESKIVRKKA